MAEEKLIVWRSQVIQTMNTRRGRAKIPYSRLLEAMDGPTDCWEWPGRRNRGYGQVVVDQVGWRAHRWVYQLLKEPIPDGLVIDHLCRNPPCVNPAHLEPVTTYVNVHRGVGLSVTRAAQTHCVNGHLFDEQNTHIRARSAGGRACRACSRDYSRLRWRRLNWGVDA